MKKLLFVSSIFLASVSWADSTTNRMHLTLPTIGSPTWGQKVNGNFQILDATAAALAFSNPWSSTNTYSGYTQFLSTVNWRNLNSGTGQCLGLDSSSNTVIVPCGTGGGGGITTLSTLTPGATTFIFNQDTLQSGATFYVSSGTVSSLNADTEIINTSLTLPYLTSNQILYSGSDLSVTSNSGLTFNPGSFPPNLNLTASNGPTWLLNITGAAGFLGGGFRIQGNGSSIGSFWGTDTNTATQPAGTEFFYGASDNYAGGYSSSDGHWVIGASSGTAKFNVSGNVLIGLNVQGTQTAPKDGLLVGGGITSISTITTTAINITSQFLANGSAGTSGQLLKSNGTGAAPSWIAAPAGGGGGTTIWAKLNGSVLDNAVSTVNVTSPLTATSSPSGQINLTVDYSSVTTLGYAPTTSKIPEGTNLYFTTARATTTISASAPILYSNGVVSIDKSSATLQGTLSAAAPITLTAGVFGVDGSFLSTTTAASTYLSQSSATATYLQLSSATATYDKKTDTIAASRIAAGSLGTSVIASSITLASMYGAPTLTGTNFTSLPGAQVTSGVPAANIAAGSLGTSVIASSVAASGVTAGSYTNTNLTVGLDGRITAASNGSAGGGGGTSTLAVGTGTASNFTTNITSPTAAISLLGSQFSSVANGTTNFVSLNPSSVTLSGPIGGSTGQIQYNNSGVFAGISGSTISTSGIAIAMQAQHLTDTPIEIKELRNQTTDLLDIVPWNGGGSSGALFSVSRSSVVLGTNAFATTLNISDTQSIYMDSPASLSHPSKLASFAHSPVAYDIIFSTSVEVDGLLAAGTPATPLDQLVNPTQFQITPYSTNVVGMRQIALVGQTAPFDQWSQSDGTVISSISVQGNAQFNQVRASTFNVTMNFLANSSAGTSGQVLQSNGTGSPPSWVTPTAGGGSSVSSFTYTFNPDQARSTSTTAACAIQNSTSSFTSQLLCDDTANEDGAWSTILSPYAGGTLSADIVFTMTSATSGNVVDQVQIYCSTDTINIDAVTWPASNSSTIAVPGTAKTQKTSTITLSTTGGSCVAGSLAMVRFTRMGGSASDTAAGDQEIRKVRIHE